MKLKLVAIFSFIIFILSSINPSAVKAVGECQIGEGGKDQPCCVDKSLNTGGLSGYCNEGFTCSGSSYDGGKGIYTNGTCLANEDLPPSTNSCCNFGKPNENGQGCVYDNNMYAGDITCAKGSEYCDLETLTCVTMIDIIPPNAQCGHTSQVCCSPPLDPCVSGFNCYGITGKGATCLSEEQCQLTGLCTSPTKANTSGGPYCDNSVGMTSGIRTAIGCIKFSNDNASNDLITIILKIATSIGGGLALALILYGVFVVTTSAGMPDKLKAGSEIITSAIIGLIFILLSVFLVNLIGINILGIPGLS